MLEGHLDVPLYGSETKNGDGLGMTMTANLLDRCEVGRRFRRVAQVSARQIYSRMAYQFPSSQGRYDLTMQRRYGSRAWLARQQQI